MSLSRSEQEEKPRWQRGAAPTLRGKTLPHTVLYGAELCKTGKGPWQPVATLLLQSPAACISLKCPPSRPTYRVERYFQHTQLKGHVLWVAHVVQA